MFPEKEKPKPSLHNSLGSVFLKKKKKINQPYQLKDISLRKTSESLLLRGYWIIPTLLPITKTASFFFF